MAAGDPLRACVRAVTASADSVLLGEVIEPNGESRTEPPVTVEAMVANGSAARVAELRNQWRAADEAVVMGRISEQRYDGIVERIKAELMELGEPA